MSEITLVIGNKNYSSWSMRPWLALAASGIPFEEKLIALYRPESAAAVALWSPSGKLPALRHGPVTIWDSLAICEYAAELYPEAGLWPDDVAARAEARAIAAEMHSGFAALRRAMPMNCRAVKPGKGHTAEADADIARIAQIWRDCRARPGAEGAFLYGRFSIVDAMFAPVASRFASYAVELDDVCRRYQASLMGLPAMRRWMAAAAAEPWVVERFEL